MSKVENYELEQRLKWLWELLGRLPAGARNFEPVNDVLAALIDDVKMAERAIEIAVQIWTVERCEADAVAAGKRMIELMRDAP